MSTRPSFLIACLMALLALPRAAPAAPTRKALDAEASQEEKPSFLLHKKPRTARHDSKAAVTSAHKVKALGSDYGEPWMIYSRFKGKDCGWSCNKWGQKAGVKLVGVSAGIRGTYVCYVSMELFGTATSKGCFYQTWDGQARWDKVTGGFQCICAYAYSWVDAYSSDPDTLECWISDYVCQSKRYRAAGTWMVDEDDNWGCAIYSNGAKYETEEINSLCT